MRDVTEDQPAFVVRIVLIDDVDDGLHEAWVVCEHEVNLEAINAYAVRCGWKATIDVYRAHVLAGTGLAEIQSWILDQNHPSHQTNAGEARLNRLEHDIVGLQRSNKRIEDLLAVIANAVPSIGGTAKSHNETIDRAADPQLHRTAFVEGARLTRPPPERPTPELSEVLAAPAPNGEQLVVRRRSRLPDPDPERTGTSNAPGGGEDFLQNTMATMGDASSQIYEASAGVDDEGLPKRGRLPVVGETLKKGNLTRQ